MNNEQSAEKIAKNIMFNYPRTDKYLQFAVQDILDFANRESAASSQAEESLQVSPEVKEEECTKCEGNEGWRDEYDEWVICDQCKGMGKASTPKEEKEGWIGVVEATVRILKSITVVTNDIRKDIIEELSRILPAPPKAAEQKL